MFIAFTPNPLSSEHNILDANATRWRSWMGERDTVYRIIYGLSTHTWFHPFITESVFSGLLATSSIVSCLSHHSPLPDQARNEACLPLSPHPTTGARDTVGNNRLAAECSGRLLATARPTLPALLLRLADSTTSCQQMFQCSFALGTSRHEPLFERLSLLP